jgi:hypothetical protein
MDYTPWSCLKGRRTTKNGGLTVRSFFRRQALQYILNNDRLTLLI